jgi:hypothetical protein
MPRIIRLHGAEIIRDSFDRSLKPDMGSVRETVFTVIALLQVNAVYEIDE